MPQTGGAMDSLGPGHGTRHLVARRREPARAAAGLEPLFGRRHRRELLGPRHAARLARTRTRGLELADAGGRGVVAAHDTPAGRHNARRQHRVGEYDVCVHAPRATQVMVHASLQLDVGVLDQQAALEEGRVLVAVRRNVGRLALGHGLDGARVKHGAAAAPDEVGLARNHALQTKSNPLDDALSPRCGHGTENTNLLVVVCARLHEQSVLPRGERAVLEVAAVARSVERRRLTAVCLARVLP